MSDDDSLEPRQVSYNRVMGDRSAVKSVRVFRSSPERVELQIRSPKHFMTATLTIDEARAIADWLHSAADHAEAKFCMFCREHVPAPCSQSDAASCPNMNAISEGKVAEQNTSVTM